MIFLMLVLSFLLNPQLVSMTALEPVDDGFEPLFYRAPDMRGMGGDKIAEEINCEMALLYPDYVKTDYYKDRLDDIGNMRKAWLANDLNIYAEKYGLPFLRSPVLYDPDDRDMSGLAPGAPPDAEIDSIGAIAKSFAGYGSRHVPVWGETYYGLWYIDWGNDAAYWFEDGWSGYRLNGSFWNGAKSRKILTYDEAYKALKDNNDKRLDIFKKNRFVNLRTIPGFPYNILDELVQYGVDEIWGGLRGADVDIRGEGISAQLRQGFIHKRGDKPKKYGTNETLPWDECVLVMIPPTYISWGYGVLFTADPNADNAVYSTEIPIAPINMLLQDIRVGFVNPPVNAAAGDWVTVRVSLNSFFPQDETVDYRWGVPSGSGTKYHNGQASGSIAISGMGNATMQVSFIMPEDGAKVTFEANHTRKVPENGNYENNAVEHFVAPLTPPTRSANIPAWVLDQEVGFDLVSTASLELPRGSWNGNATGNLDILGDSAIYNDFTVSNNPIVNEASAAITRQPEIAAVLDRADFGDDPKNGRFAPDNVPISKTALVTGSGLVSRPYKYTISRIDPDGTIQYSVRYRTAVADFTDINDVRTYTFDVYNGMRTLPLRKSFRNEAGKTSIQNNGLTYNLYWEGTPIPFDVARWMCSRSASNAEYGWEAINGRYQRSFVGQSTGSILWETVVSQAAGYREDRENARAGRTGRSYSANAVFATDKNMQSIGYPVKSGYYFNPLGLYTCTIRTAQYKGTDGPTDEHKELVEKAKGAFRYSSDLQYITVSRDVTKLTNVSQGNDRSVLAVSDEDSSIVSTRLETTLSRTGYVDALLCEVMEGYSESLSVDSWLGYKYRERTDKSVYLIEEETVISFALAPPYGTDMYTHVNMPNGDYAIRVWAEQFEFVGPSVKKAGLSVQNSGYFDVLRVTVRGSMYDDR